MPNHRGLDTDIGWQKREFRKVWKAIRESNAAKRLQAATIGAGGVTIKDGGFLRYLSPNGNDAVFVGSALRDGTGGFGFVIVDDNDAAAFEVTCYDAATVPPDGDASVFAQADRIVMRSRSGASEVWMDDTQTYVNAGANQLHLFAGGGVTVQWTATGSSANAFIDTDGRIWRSTSSLRYKQDVEDAEVDPAAVLQMQARTWRDKAEVAADPDTETRYVGFIAEELHDLGLGQFVVYDKDGDPEAISYDRLSAALLAVLKDQQAAIDDLREKVAGLADPAEAQKGNDPNERPADGVEAEV